MTGLILIPIFLAFLVSSSVGLGGSLVLVPALALALGPKEGVALAALLLGLNNTVKVVAYRDVLPVRAAVGLIVATMVGALIGARALVATPERSVAIAVVAALIISLAAERLRIVALQRASSPVLALASGATSGFSGTSGPLKGAAVKSLRLDHLHTVGAASLVSLAGDLTKTAVFADAGLLDNDSWRIAAMAVPVMLVATFVGRRLVERLGPRRWSLLFWVTMAGYGVRLAV